ncbi:sterile alpha motif domain-containing protein 1-like [Balaenoptera ricei]|uniref:sterile alpha motif domain-containing protein 1-like n=1 Tax=Balaenoptera ricei TaxID=2746895 RepID=UPI0028BEE307|nr:sterile alpha motif domain-containing protein 1-like [Balaenoptera ricei]XP_059750989.1 sterile alpha motif domain-containing protein 1-like [Balaenoptera ricei]XP_059750990.1 sterile alpha motif domain-containing protein 1-like [Balaenoptera ricei]XP_059750991.1 sterile alpha motif domain-containing protein 1-like [Balaenoptera ricei]XP_059750992.1 sterile alpha motif domain-containing protein 1-like [Balaenoptera ricei]
MRAPTPARPRRAALGWGRRRQRPPGTSLCAGPRAAASQPHPRPGRQAPGAGRGGEGPDPGRCAGVSRGRRLGPGSPGPEEEPAPPPPPPAPPRSRGRAHRRRCRCSRCRFSATHRRDTRAGQPRQPPACRRCAPPELRAAPPAARLRVPTAPRASRHGPLRFPSRPRTKQLTCRRPPRPPQGGATPRIGPRALRSAGAELMT